MNSKYFVIALLVIFQSVFYASAGQSADGEKNVGLSGKRIVGGEPCNIEDYPYQVSVVSVVNNTNGCGGSLITTSHVLTAAHCTDIWDPEDLLIRAGTSLINEGGVLKQVVKITQHDQFDFETFDYDIAILKVAEPFDTSSKIQTVRLPSPNNDVPGDTMGTATGWGYLSFNGTRPSQLQKVDLPVIAAEICQPFFKGGVTARMICAGYLKGEKDTCQGDSGGPFVISGVQVGITSFGDGCGAMNSPGGYTKVSKFIEFINQAIQD